MAHDLMGMFLEDQLMLCIFATLTTAFPVSRERLQYLVFRWKDAYQKASRTTLGSILSLEAEPSLHAHIALAAWRPLDCDLGARLWTQTSGSCRADSALVVPYHPGTGGMGYLLKQLDSEHEEIHLSHNLHLFNKCTQSSCLHSNRALRRLSAQRGTSERPTS